MFRIFYVFAINLKGALQAMQKRTTPTIYQKRALLLCIFLGILVFGSILWIVLHGHRTLLSPAANNIGNTTSTTLLYADIYQNGELKQSILLSDVTESYTFTIYNEQDNFNQIQVRPGSIGITSASCPDQLCVHQGFIQTSLLPITCLPNRLVIQLRVEKPNEADYDNQIEITPDIITY